MLNVVKQAFLSIDLRKSQTVMPRINQAFPWKFRRCMPAATLLLAGATACGGFCISASGTCGAGGTGLVASAPVAKEVDFTRSVNPIRFAKPT